MQSLIRKFLSYREIVGYDISKFLRRGPRPIAPRSAIDLMLLKNALKFYPSFSIF